MGQWLTCKALNQQAATMPIYRCAYVLLLPLLCQRAAGEGQREGGEGESMRKTADCGKSSHEPCRAVAGHRDMQGSQHRDPGRSNKSPSAPAQAHESARGRRTT